MVALKSFHHKENKVVNFGKKFNVFIFLWQLLMSWFFNGLISVILKFKIPAGCLYNVFIRTQYKVKVGNSDTVGFHFDFSFLHTPEYQP